MYYIDSTSFSTATAVYTDELLTTKAADGFYKFGSGYREQLSGLLLNNIECTTCIDCKRFTSFDYKTGTGVGTIDLVITYTDCWGYNHTLNYNALPGTNGNVSTITLDYTLCVKNNSVNSTTISLFTPYYDTDSACNIATELVQSLICGPGSETPTGCDIDCTALESSYYVWITNTTPGYLQDGDVVYNTNNTGDLFLGGHLYYKINYDNRVYGVRINDAGDIYELTYCNP